MPPRTSLTSSFSVSDANNEVVCPLTNNDGSNCRKRCLGEKRFRSMQEHIRRAHPSHYIPKLPATEESFLLMVNTPLDQRAHLNPQANNSAPSKKQPDRDVYGADANSPATRTLDEAHPAATAAVALTQLHHHRMNSEWESEMDSVSHSDNDVAGKERMRSSIELPPLRDQLKQDPFANFERPRELLPSIMNHSPPGRSSTLPPIQRSDKIQRPRKSSLSQSRKPKHERARSKESGRRSSLNDRKALSAEPQTAAWVQGKRWEDLIEAATSATEVEDDRDTTPAPHSPAMSALLNHASPVASGAKNRNSLPPSFQSSNLPPLSSAHRAIHTMSYTASPLQKALTPPPYEFERSRENDLEPFPSIESSLMDSTSRPYPAGNAESSPLLPSQARAPHRFSNPTPPTFSRNRDIRIACANCSRVRPIAECYACTECICGVCRECLSLVVGSPSLSMGSPNKTANMGPTSYPSARACPRCRTVGGKWKAFQLDFR
ncbi:hypothetical protein VTN31DRAFT_2615 [Thermomyces dupontii]|uniref:uncharacterized protein n=1 Tax=Talaromyces thermophilus TaxID=28565 RepID=UPI00374305AA